MNNKGFSSVYIALILSSLVLLVLVLVEAASGFGAGSITENCCYLAGKSVLSEYQKDVYKRYGLLFLRNDEEDIEKIAEYYINANLAVKNGIIRPKLEELTVDTSEYSGLNADASSGQIKVLGAALAAERLITEDGLSGIISALEDGRKASDDKRDSALQSLKKLSKKPKTRYDENGDPIPESSESKSKRRQAKELTSRYTEAMNPVFGEINAEKDIKSYRLSNLPTRIMEIGKSSPLTYAGGLLQILPSSLAEAVYIDEVCSNYVNTVKDNCLEGEMEYILFGNLSDEENVKAARTSVYTLRIGLNLADIYKNQEKMAEYAAIAAASFPMIPTGIAVFILALSDAAIKSREDMGVLFSGGRVPVVKGTSIGTYSDYLTLMILSMDRQTRLLRFFDIVQLNTVHVDGGNFSFRDYCCGFNLEAGFRKNVYLPLSFDISQRFGEINQVHVYK